MKGFPAVGTTLQSDQDRWALSAEFHWFATDRWPGKWEPPSGGSDLCTAPAPGLTPSSEEGGALNEGSGWSRPGQQRRPAITCSTKFAEVRGVQLEENS